MGYKDKKKMSKYMVQWDRENTIKYGVKCFKTTDARLIEIMSAQKNKQQFLKKAIAYYYDNGCPGLDDPDE